MHERMREGGGVFGGEKREWMMPTTGGKTRSKGKTKFQLSGEGPRHGTPAKSSFSERRNHSGNMVTNSSKERRCNLECQISKMKERSRVIPIQLCRRANIIEKESYRFEFSIYGKEGKSKRRYL